MTNYLLQLTHGLSGISDEPELTLVSLDSSHAVSETTVTADNSSPHKVSSLMSFEAHEMSQSDSESAMRHVAVASELPVWTSDVSRAVASGMGLMGTQSGVGDMSTQSGVGDMQSIPPPTEAQWEAFKNLSQQSSTDLSGELSKLRQALDSTDDAADATDLGALSDFGTVSDMSQPVTSGKTSV